MISVAGGAVSVGDPPTKTGTHSITLPMYSDLVGIVSVCTTVLAFVGIEPGLMSGNHPMGVPFTSQPTTAPDDM